MGEPRDFNWRLIAMLSLVSAVVVVAWSATGTPTEAGPSAEIVRPSASTDIILSRPQFYTQESFVAGLSAAELVPSESDVRAMLVPHHLLAAPLIADGLKRATGRPIDTVVIVGPNHEEIGPSVMITDATWETPFGQLEANQQLVEKMRANLVASQNAEGFRNEHSIGALMPFVQHYAPDARVLPILLRYDTGDEIDALADWLHQNLPPDSLVVFSVDFSHYLTKVEADQNDEQTEQWIKDGRTDQLLSLDSDYLDSPPTVGLALKLAELENIQLQIVGHANSDDFQTQSAAQTTSYFELVWR